MIKYLTKKEKVFYIVFDIVLGLLFISFILGCFNPFLVLAGKPEFPFWFKVLIVIIMGLCIISIIVLLLYEKKYLHPSKKAKKKTIKSKKSSSGE